VNKKIQVASLCILLCLVLLSLPFQVSAGGVDVPVEIPVTDFLFIDPVAPDFGVELPECISTNAVVLPSTLYESALNAAVREISEIVSNDDGVSRIAVQKTMLGYVMARAAREMNPNFAVRLPAFRADVNEGQSALAVLPLPESVASKSPTVRDIAAVKVRSKSAGASLFYAPAFSVADLSIRRKSEDGLEVSITPADGVFGVLKSDKKTFVGENERLVPGQGYFLLFSVKDGGEFDSSNMPGVVADPLFLSEYTAIPGGGGGCSAVAATPFQLVLAIPLLGMFFRRK